MRYIDVADEYVNQILKANKLSNQSLTEAECPSHDDKDKKKPEEMKKKKEMDGKESTELHQCPLCESELDEALTVERIQEHIEQILETINEAEEFEGEDLDEEKHNDGDDDGDDDGEEDDEEDN
jgi:hypothetical protein